MDVHLVGEANDYVGKSMSGGDISIVPPPNSTFQVRGRCCAVCALCVLAPQGVGGMVRGLPWCKKGAGRGALCAL